MKLLICNLLNILIFVFDTKLQIIDFLKIRKKDKLMIRKMIYYVGIKLAYN